MSTFQKDLTITDPKVLSCSSSSSSSVSSNSSSETYSTLNGSEDLYRHDFTPLEFLTTYVSCCGDLEEDVPKTDNEYNLVHLKEYYKGKQPILHSSNITNPLNTYSQETNSELTNKNKNTNETAKIDSHNRFGNIPRSFHINPLDNKTLHGQHSLLIKQHFPNFLQNDNISPSLNIKKPIKKNKCPACKNDSSCEAIWKTLNDDEKALLEKEINFYNPYIYKRTILESMLLNKEKNTTKIWIPVSRFSKESTTRVGNIVDNALLDKDRLQEMPKRGAFDGVAFFPKQHGSFKIPALVYHTAVECKENTIMVLGGVQPYSDFLNDEDEDGDSLKDFYVSKLQGVPFALVEDILENPNMIANNFIYKIDTVTNTTTRINPLGDVPPPLVCAKATKLNSRLIFYYGGLEIVTEISTDNETNLKNVFLKRRPEFHRSCYILNIETGVFKRIKLETENINEDNVDGTSYEFPSRFSHSQCLLTGQHLKHFEYGFKKYLKSQTTDQIFSSRKNSSIVSLSNFLQSHDNILHNSTSSVPDTNTSDLNKSKEEEEEEEEEEDDDYDYEEEGKQDFNEENDNESDRQLNILIFGGYKSSNKETFEPANDMWRIKLNIKNDDAFSGLQPTAIATQIHLKNECELPPPRAHHSTTLLAAEKMEKKNTHEFSDVIKNLGDLIENFSNNPNELTKYYNIINDPYLKADKKLFQSKIAPYKDKVYQQDRQKNSLEQKKRKKNQSATLMIHGGYNKEGQMLDDFWFFNFKQFKWIKKPLFAKTETAYFNKDHYDKTKSAEKKEIHIKLAGHKFISKGKFLISLGGIIDGETCDFKRLLKSRTMITVLNLPDMEALDIISLNDTSPPRVMHNILTGEHEVVKCSNGTFYIISGIVREYFAKDIIEGTDAKERIIKDRYSYETGKSFIQMCLNGAVIGILPPSFTNLN
ncbi:hypothetical protein ACO0SA_002813 [Hanseniaspora valbyensis]